MRVSNCALIAVAALVVGGCDAYTETPLPPTPVGRAGPAEFRPELLGTWVGSSEIADRSTLPTTPPAGWPAHWQVGTIEAMTLTVTQGSLAQYHARLVEPSSQTNCDLVGDAGPTGMVLGGGSLGESYWWADLSSLSDCHVLVDTTRWPGSGPKPFVWAVDNLLLLDFTSAAHDELRGELRFRYDWSTRDPWTGPWTPLTIKKTVTLRRQAP